MVTQKSCSMHKNYVSIIMYAGVSLKYSSAHKKEGRGGSKVAGNQARSSNCLMYCEVEVLKLHFFFVFLFPSFCLFYFFFHDHHHHHHRHPDIFWRAFHVLYLNCRYCCVCVNVHLDMSLSLSIRSWFLLTLRFRLTSSVVDISLELKEETKKKRNTRGNLKCFEFFFMTNRFLFHFGGGEMKGRFRWTVIWNEKREIEVERRKYVFHVAYAAVNFICVLS